MFAANCSALFTVPEALTLHQSVARSKLGLHQLKFEKIESPLNGDLNFLDFSFRYVFIGASGAENCLTVKVAWPAASRPPPPGVESDWPLSAEEVQRAPSMGSSLARSRRAWGSACWWSPSSGSTAWSHCPGPPSATPSPPPRNTREVVVSKEICRPAVGGQALHLRRF